MITASAMKELIEFDFADFQQNKTLLNLRFFLKKTVVTKSDRVCHTFFFSFFNVLMLRQHFIKFCVPS